MTMANAKTQPTPTAAKKPAPAPGASANSGGAAEQDPAADTAPETRTYCVGDCPVLHDGKHYRPGHDLELTDAQAERLGHKVSLLTAALPGEPTTAE